MVCPVSGRVTTPVVGLISAPDRLRAGAPLPSAAMAPRLKTTLQIAGLCVVAAALVAVWVFTPVGDYADPDKIAELIKPLTQSPFLPLYILGAFLVAGALLISVWLIIFQACLLYSPAVAFPLALFGATLSAVTYYGLGRLLGRDVVARLAPPRVQRALERTSLESIVAIRVLPILPFTLVNMTCGAFGVPFRTFLLGTVIGMAPGVLGMTFLGDRLLSVIKNPSPASIGALIAVVVALVVVAQLLRRRAARRYIQDAIASESPPPPA